jgi:hypothetical protein
MRDMTVRHVHGYMPMNCIMTVCRSFNWRGPGVELWVDDTVALAAAALIYIRARVTERQMAGQTVPALSSCRA